EYAGYLLSRSRQRTRSVRPRWTMNLSKRYYFQYTGKYLLLLHRQPGGWIVTREIEAVTSPETLSTMLDGMPVLFPQLKLAALVAESHLKAIANLHWKAESMFTVGTHLQFDALAPSPEH